MLQQARLIVAEKLDSIGLAAEHYLRHGKSSAPVQHVLREAPVWRRRAETAQQHDSLRGIEGAASRGWFQALDQLLPEGWKLPGRRKRPPTDPVNALLSLGYTLLLHRVEAACLAWGLDSALGVYHEYRPGRASLACDLMEPFRVAAVDRVLLACLARGQFRPEDFVQNESDMAVRLTEQAWKRWLEALETQMHTPGPGGSTLHRQLVQRIGRFAESLPAWDGRWPSAPDPEEPSQADSAPGLPE